MIKFAFAFERICFMKFAFNECAFCLASSHPQTKHKQTTIVQHTLDICISTELTLSACKVQKPASPTVTNSHRSLIYSRIKTKYRLGNFGEKTVTNNVVSGSSESADPVLWELRGERVELKMLAIILRPSCHNITTLDHRNNLFLKFQIIADLMYNE